MSSIVVSIQIALLGKHFAANGTREGLFSVSMLDFMTTQVIGTIENGITLVARKVALFVNICYVLR